MGGRGPPGRGPPMGGRGLPPPSPYGDYRGPPGGGYGGAGYGGGGYGRGRTTTHGRSWSRFIWGILVQLLQLKLQFQTN